MIPALFRDRKNDHRNDFVPHVCRRRRNCHCETLRMAPGRALRTLSQQEPLDGDLPSSCAASYSSAIIGSFRRASPQANVKSSETLNSVAATDWASGPVAARTPIFALLCHKGLLVRSISSVRNQSSLLSSRASPLEAAYSSPSLLSLRCLLRPPRRSISHRL